MSLLFAQRHPELVKAVVIGGVWANTKEEVYRYMSPNGTRAMIPGLRETFRGIGGRDGMAGSLHRAIRDGVAGKSLIEAYMDSEGIQAQTDVPVRERLVSPVKPAPGSRFSMAGTTDRWARFAFIESEMMWRGERGAWNLGFRFPSALRGVPLVVIQGRYDQVCDPMIAVKVYDAWPGDNKLLVPINTNHAGMDGVPKESLKAVGAPNDPATVAAFKRALLIHMGSGRHMIDAAIEEVRQGDGRRLD